MFWISYLIPLFGAEFDASSTRSILKFHKSIKSDITKKIYEYNLSLYLEFCGVDKFEDLIE
jgi:hypothetical protein